MHPWPSPSPAFPTRGRVSGTMWRAVVPKTPSGTSPLVGEVGRGAAADALLIASYSRRCKQSSLRPRYGRQIDRRDWGIGPKALHVLVGDHDVGKFEQETDD